MAVRLVVVGIVIERCSRNCVTRTAWDVVRSEFDRTFLGGRGIYTWKEGHLP